MRRLRVLDVDDRGISLLAFVDGPVDVRLDGRRVWTFWVRRDTVRSGGPLTSAVAGPVLRRVDWPKPLRRHLDGTSRVTLAEPESSRVHFDRELRFGTRDQRIEVRNEQGAELGIDKSGRLVPTFGTRSDQSIGTLLNATESVIGALRSARLEPFLAYGTLLGAVREGRVLPHDSDADLGYISHHTTPVDVIRESFAVQRTLAEQGWRISRYSGGAFKIDVEEQGTTTGLDVFGGFYDAGRLYLMGEIGADYRRDWIFPLTEATLHGRPFPVPAVPERLLEAAYGPGWRVPDPAFKFETPDRTTRALEDWFRGTQPNARYWARRANATAGRPVRKPSRLARQAAAKARDLDAQVLDIGAGRGHDSLWLARQGLSVTAYDYLPKALASVRSRAESAGVAVDTRYLNLTEWRSVLAEGARLAHDPRPRVVLARHLLDATSPVGRESLARLCGMALRRGGRLLAEFDQPPDDDSPPDWMVGRVDPDQVATLLRDAGASRVKVERVRKRDRTTTRLVGVW